MRTFSEGSCLGRCCSVETEAGAETRAGAEDTGVRGALRRERGLGRSADPFPFSPDLLLSLDPIATRSTRSTRSTPSFSPFSTFSPFSAFSTFFLSVESKGGRVAEGRCDSDVKGKPWAKGAGDCSPCVWGCVCGCASRCLCGSRFGEAMSSVCGGGTACAKVCGPLAAAMGESPWVCGCVCEPFKKKDGKPGVKKFMGDPFMGLCIIAPCAPNGLKSKPPPKLKPYPKGGSN